jgi:hypothetical protein
MLPYLGQYGATTMYNTVQYCKKYRNSVFGEACTGFKKCVWNALPAKEQSEVIGFGF